MQLIILKNNTIRHKLDFSKIFDCLREDWIKGKPNKHKRGLILYWNWKYFLKIGNTSYRETVSSVVSCVLFQVGLLRLQGEGGPHMMKIEQVVTLLEQSNQVTLLTLEDMLCRTPTGKRKPIMEERRTSRRTLKPIQSTLLLEWEKLSAIPSTKGSDIKAEQNQSNTLTRPRVDFVTIASSTSPKTQTVTSLQICPFLVFLVKTLRSPFKFVQHTLQVKADERKKLLCTSWFGMNVLYLCVNEWLKVNLILNYENNLFSFCFHEWAWIRFPKWSRLPWNNGQLSTSYACCNHSSCSWRLKGHFQCRWWG